MVLSGGLMSVWRSRWAALGAAVAVGLGGGGMGLVSASLDAGDRPVTVTVAPERIVDTRVDLGLTGGFVSQAPRDVQVTGAVAVASGGSKTVVPVDAVGVLVNVTVVGPVSPGYLTLRPGGSAGEPATSTVNFTAAGVVEPNAATVALGPGGKMQVYLFTSAPAGTADVLVDVVGYTIGHTHDDRYYTKAQSDAQRAATKFLSLNIYADPGLNFDERWADLADSGVGGLNVDLDFNFTIPPDYTSGTPMTVRLLAYARDSTSFPCNGELSAGWVYVGRPDVSQGGVGGSVGPVEILYVFTDNNVPKEYLFTLDSTTGLRPGDSVGFGIFGLGPATRCSLVVSGASILYR